MPLYEFCCGDCGTFDEFRPAAESSRPVACPACGEPARRVLTTPGIARLPRHVSEAHARNEKSRHEPEVVRRASGDGHGHGHDHAKPHPSHGRPWQVGH